MLCRTGLLALAAVLCLAAAPTEKQVVADKEKMLGTYELYGLDINGKSIDSDLIRTFQVVVTLNTITIKANVNTRESTYRLDPTKDPKTIDLIWKDQVTLGIYSINGEKFKMCLAKEGSRKRPNDFESVRGSDWRYFNLHRVKK